MTIDKERLENLIAIANLTPQSQKIKDPMMFKIIKGSKTSILLGAHDFAPLSAFPESCLRALSDCDKLFVEKKLTTPEEKIIFRDHFLTIYGHGGEESWYHELSPKHKKMINEIVDNKLGQYGEEFRPLVKTKDISSRKVFDYIVSEIQVFVSPFLDDVFGIERIDEIGMRDRLAILFKNSIGALEPHSFEDMLSANSGEEGVDIADLVEALNFLQKATKIGDPKKILKFVKLKRSDIFEKTLDAAREYDRLYLEGDYLSSPEFAMLQDKGDETTIGYVNEMQGRILSRSIDIECQNHERPLFAIRATSLIGNSGLLVKLRNMGFVIEKFDCKTNEFAPYSYHCELSLRAFESIRQSIVYGNQRVNEDEVCPNTLSFAKKLII